MTVSRQRRLEDQALVLRTLATELGDEMIVKKWWDIDRPDFADLIPTTWAELEEQGFIRRHQQQLPPANPLAYELTEAGWIAGLRVAGVIESEPFRARCVELVKYFKSTVDGRRQPADAFVTPDEMHEHFPFPWVLNILRSRLLEEMFPGKRMNARWDERQKIIRVPVTFGMPE